MRRRTKWLLGVTGGVVALFVLLVGIGSQLPPLPAGDARQGGAPAPAAPEAAAGDGAAAPAEPKPVEIAADDLDQAFSDNEIAAKDRFADRPLIVTGTVRKVSEVTRVLHANSAAIDLAGKDGLSTVTAFLPNKSDAATFRPGDVTALRCEGVTSGWSGLNLSDCTPNPERPR